MVADMLLAVDVGNTNTTFAVFTLCSPEDTGAPSNGSGMLANWRVRTDGDRTADEYWVLLSNLLAGAEIAASDLDAVCISSVVPGTVEPLKLFCSRYLKISEPLVLSAATAGIKVHYDPPSDVGADRIANAAAAYELYGGPAIVVDFGTATTLDAGSADGE